MSNNTQTEDTYRAPRTRVEYDRLSTQHELIKAAMGGQLLRCPVNLSRPDLRVLDSGTAQALWPLDVARTVPATATLVGTDIAPQHFPPPEERPANLTLLQQSIHDPWPAEMRGSFDAVHQRFVLAACPSADAARAAVAGLWGCVRPGGGGWMELHEGNMHVIREGPQHGAMMRFRDTMVSAWQNGIGQMTDPGPRLGGWLRAVGAVDIVEEVQVIKLGAEADDPEQGDRAMAVLLNMLDGMKPMLAGKPGHPSAEEFDKLRADLIQELNEVGNYWEYYLAFGRKP
ncbi:S-adenosyl-L-methionine-dependent methyltransferase [Chaetomidium leptoderma]|uniref:S-adenosyl-L-methionine-dependent methyltransferase n=1 Tax=Chaetomidium leptoderma TaxID=669021 RepID=A0AAN6ZXG1_9PEZI|nr:S-adenosyl-L-methionine-dependent methyltransferase [Chaetomidium leptoderma]